MSNDAAVAAVLGKRAAKTRKGRKILSLREPQVKEDAKSALILSGNKCSNEMQAFLREIYHLRAPLATLFMRRHSEHPFEDIKRVESLCTKYDHSLFAFGSTSKKRPSRLIFGRLFDGKLLDMQEYSVEGYKPSSSFPNKVRETIMGSKPLVIFQGAGFETDERLKRTKSLLLDFFGGPKPDSVLLQGIEHVVVCSTFDQQTGGSAAASSAAPGSSAPVRVQRFRVQLLKAASKLPRVELEEIGPDFKLTLDRSKEPDRDRWKMAIKVPKQVKPKKVKNVQGDSLGKKRGRIHLGKQDFDQIHTVHHGGAKLRKLEADLAKAAEA
jgi:ribosome production factor 2